MGELGGAANPKLPRIAVHQVFWRIPLQSRTGNGFVYSSRFCSDDDARATLLGNITGKTITEPLPLKFKTGRRVNAWHKNCVAVGLSAGFLEPLEASALVLVELSAAMISEQLPANRGVMDIVAKRFNEKFRYRWDRIIDFLKLHYILTWISIERASFYCFPLFMILRRSFRHGII